MIVTSVYAAVVSGQLLKTDYTDKTGNVLNSSNIKGNDANGAIVAMRQDVTREVEIPVSQNFTGIVQVESGKDVIIRKMIK